MKVFARYPDDRFEDISHFEDSKKLILCVEFARREFPRTKNRTIERNLYYFIESGETAGWAEDIRIFRNEIWLDVPDFEAQDRRERCGEAIIYADEAKKFGLADDEIAEDLTMAGLASVDDAERIVAL